VPQPQPQNLPTMETLPTQEQPRAPHLLSLPFAMASSDPMPRYFFTFTPLTSKYSPAPAFDDHYAMLVKNNPLQDNALSARVTASLLELR